jgi:hypothetical protein
MMGMEVVEAQAETPTKRSYLTIILVDLLDMKSGLVGD